MLDRPEQRRLFHYLQSIPVERNPEVSELLAAFVEFDEEDKKHTDWEKDGAVYFSIPKLQIELAKKCRSHSLVTKG